MKPAYAFKTAEFDKDERFRYSLERWFSMSGKSSVLWVGLNPSTADADIDDPTIRREAEYTRAWGFTRYLKANVHAYRSTNPKWLYGQGFDPVGLRNRVVIEELMSRADLIVACWGRNKLHPGAVEIAKIILADPRTRCLGVTKGGAVKHPLYLAKTTSLQQVAPAKGYIAL